jgi:DNA repair protein RecN (Recombination protein N)
VSVLVFDEIDANVGGRLGSTIGSKLRNLAVHHQVLCITHLPQIASYADRHLTVRKQSDGNQTRTTVRAISGDEQLEELSEMIGGQRITATTRAQAKELLDSAQASPAQPRNDRTPSKPRARKAV